MQLQYSITTRKKDKGIQYIISYKDASGNWKQKSKQGFKKVEDAKAAARIAVKALEEDFELQAKLNKEHEGKTFKDFADMYIKHLELYKEGNTSLAYTSTFNAFSDLNEKEMKNIDSADIQECVDKIVKQGCLSRGTIKTYLSRLSTAFKYAIKTLKMITINPIVNIDLTKDKGRPEKRALTQAQLSDLLSRIKKRKYYIITLIAAKCGLRIGEILGLTWGDIKNNFMNIHQQWKRKSDRSYGFGDLKSINSNRKVPVSPDVMEELEKYKNEFPLNWDGRLFNYKNVTVTSNLLARAYTKAGYDITVHELRHTYATTLIANGLDFKTVAKLMGHDVSQTLKTYSHVTDEMMESAIDLINKIF
jgi:integrase